MCIRDRYSYGLILESVKNIKSGTAIQKETLLFNLNSNQAKEIKEWKAGDVGVAYDRDAMYLLKSDDLTLYRSALYPDSAGPEEKVIDCTDLIPDTYTGIALDRAVYDRHLIFQITSEQSGVEPLYLSLTLDGLETREMRLMCKRNGEEQLSLIHIFLARTSIIRRLSGLTPSALATTSRSSLSR